MLEALGLLLKLKFGDVGLQFVAELQSASLEQLRAVLATIESAGSIEELREKTQAS